MIEGVEAKNVTQWATFFASQSETISLLFRETTKIIRILWPSFLRQQRELKDHLVCCDVLKT